MREGSDDVRDNNKLDCTHYCESLRAKLQNNKHLIGVVAGSRMTGKYAVMAGCDMLFALSSGRFRTTGYGSLAGYLCYSNSNEMVMDYDSRELLPFADKVPIIFGLNATDPTRNIYEYIREIKEMGFAGINNYPTVGMIDGYFRRSLEEDGIDFQQEIEAISFAHYCGLMTVAFTFSAQQAEEMTRAGADIICAHFGLTIGGYVGAKKVLTLEGARRTAEEIFEAADRIRPDVIKMVYGGPVKSPADAQFMYQGSRCQGYIGGSVFERTPVEQAILNATREFTEERLATPSSRIERMLFDNPGHYSYAEFVKEYLEENYMSDIYLSELANTLHLSAPYLSNILKNEFGESFQSYLIKLRMCKARELVLAGDNPLVKISQMVGYKDYAQFSKMYKKVYGVSPMLDFKNHK